MERRGAQVSPLTHASWNRGTIIITGAAASAGAFGGLLVYVGIDRCLTTCDTGWVVASTAVGGLLGGIIGKAISNGVMMYVNDDDPRSALFSVAPYLHEDASGLTFSSRF